MAYPVMTAVEPYTSKMRANKVEKHELLENEALPRGDVMGVLRWQAINRVLLLSSHPSVSAMGRFSSVGCQKNDGAANLVCRLRPKQSLTELTKTLFRLPLTADSKNAKYAIEAAGDASDATDASTTTTTPDCQRLTYGQFWEMVGRYASCLKALGVARGDRVAAQVSKSPHSVALYVATLQLGAIYLPLNTDYTFDEIKYFIGNAEPTLFVCQDKMLPDYRLHQKKLCKRLQVQILGERDLNAMTAEWDPTVEITAVEPDHVAAICYTSGTTGKPKGAMITHANLLSNASALCRLWEVTEDDVLLHALPIYHVHGLMVALNTLLLKGGSLIFLPRFDTDVVMQWLPKATIMMGVPTYYTRLLANPSFGPALIPNFRLFISGSAPLSESVWQEFARRSGGHEILERYGMTEGQMVCSNPYRGKRRPGTVGPAVPDVEVRVRNDMLEYRGPNVFKGYWRAPDRTKSEFTDDGWFVSGDLARLTEEGYVQILGRGKDLIISGGLNVYPKEVEMVLDQCSGVKETAVIGVPHPDFGEAVVGVVVPEEGGPAEKDLLIQVKEKCAGFKTPKRIVFEDELPRNVMGKVQKNLLRDKYSKLFDKHRSTVTRG